MSALRVGVLKAVKRAALVWDRIDVPEPGLVVLAYHRVGAGSGLELDLPDTAFDRQMAWLAASGRAVSLREGLETLVGAHRATGPSPVAVTFDDGTADLADHAAPVLERHRIPATIYVATSFIDEQRPFDYGAPPLSWAALRDLCTSGLVTVGSHTHGHTVMRTLDHATADDELRRSNDLIGEHLGAPAEHFAYPKGVLGSPAAETSVRRRYRSAALAAVGPNRYGHTDVHRLRRSPIQASDDFTDFTAKVAGGMRLEGTTREAMNRLRYAGREH